MAVESAAIKYASSMTYGNVAYDLGRIAVPEYEAPERSAPVPKERERTRTVTHTAPKTGISLFAIIGFAVIAVLMVFVLLANARLTEISCSVSEERDRITLLEQEHKQLEVRYETEFNLNELRTYAIENLGMTESTTNYTVTLAGDRSDMAVILAESSGGAENAISEITGFLSSLLAYFK